MGKYKVKDTFASLNAWVFKIHVKWKMPKYETTYANFGSEDCTLKVMHFELSKYITSYL